MGRTSHTRAWIVAALVVGLAAGALLPTAFGNGEAAPTAIRHALAKTPRVQGAPGRELVLSRVLIEPGAKLALHHHRGTQVARIQSGVLRYTVESGAVVVRRGDADRSRVVRRIKAGQTGSLRPGDSIVEQPSDHHSAVNRGARPVVVYLATLLAAGAPPSTPLD